MKQYVIEIVEFKLVNGATAAQVIAANVNIEAIISELDGFLGRELAQGDDGQWVDIVRWTDMKAAKAAAEQAGQIDGFGEFMKLLDMESVKMQHLTTQYIAEK